MGHKTTSDDGAHRLVWKCCLGGVISTFSVLAIGTIRSPWPTKRYVLNLKLYILNFEIAFLILS